MDDIQQQVAFGMGRTSAQSVDHLLFDDPIWALAWKVVSGRRSVAGQCVAGQQWQILMENCGSGGILCLPPSAVQRE